MRISASWIADNWNITIHDLMIIFTKSLQVLEAALALKCVSSPGSEGRTGLVLAAELQLQAGIRRTAGAVAVETAGAAARSAGVFVVLEAQEQPD
jgi:hypothetical protein